MKKLCAMLICASYVMLSTFGAVTAATVGGNNITSKGACVMDYETGEILYEYYGNTPRVPASMTKIMTMYLVYEALEKGEISLDTIVPISKKVYTKSQSGEYQSVLPLNYNANYTVDELIDVTVTYSASSAAVALAELLGGGSEYTFVNKMNDKVRQMGLDAYFYDSCGLAENKISPISMAKLARSIIHDYPDILKRSNRTSVMFRGRRYGSTNRLLDKIYYEGADGLKTGTKSSAGCCFCGTAVRDGERVISVTMFSSSGTQRFIDTRYLLDYGFKILKDRKGVFFTNMRTFINENEMPTFVYKGEDVHAAIIAEDLKDYGFDVSWNTETLTLSLEYNPEKPLTKIPLEYYRDKNGEKAYNVIKNNTVRVVVKKDGQEFELCDIYNLDGYMCISIDELQNIYSFEWNSDELAAYIVT